jgi:hypothetical protein
MHALYLFAVSVDVFARTVYVFAVFSTVMLCRKSFSQSVGDTPNSFLKAVLNALVEP